MIRGTICFLAVLSAALVAGASIAAVRYGGAGYWGVSIPELIINPEKYDGKPVIVKGFLQYSGAGFIYTTRENALMSDDSNAIWLVGLPSNARPMLEQLCGDKFAAIYGKFSRIKDPRALADWAIIDIEIIYTFRDLDDSKNPYVSKVCWSRKKHNSRN